MDDEPEVVLRLAGVGESGDVGVSSASRQRPAYGLWTAATIHRRVVVKAAFKRVAAY